MAIESKHRAGRRPPSRSALPSVMAAAHRPLLIRLVANAMVQAVSSVLLALTMQHLVSTFVVRHATHGTGALLLATLPGALAMLTLAWLRRHETIDAEALAQDYVQALRERVFARLLKSAPVPLQQQGKGNLLMPFVGDLGALRQWVSVGIARAITASTILGCLLMALFWLAPAQAAVLLLVLLLCAAGSVPLSGRLQQAVRALRRERGQLSSWVSERLLAVGVVQAQGQSHRERDVLHERALRMRTVALWRARETGNLRAMAQLGFGVGSLGAVLTAVWMADADSTGASVGEVVLALTLMGLVLPNLRDLARVPELYSPAQVAWQRLRRLMRAQPRLATLHRLPDADAISSPMPDNDATSGELRFADVQIAHARGSAGGATFSGTVGAGTRVALIGRNGSGKSTLLEMAARLRDPDAGSVLLDGVDLRALAPGFVRRRIALVSPALPLLRGSLAENLDYGARVADESRRASILRGCGIDELAARLARGLATELGDRGAALSAGERTLVQLARALLRRPRVLLLDEIEAHLDAEVRVRVVRLLKRFRGTILFATHDPQWAALADHCINLDAVVQRSSEASKDAPGQDGPIQNTPSNVVLLKEAAPLTTSSRSSGGAT